MTTTLRLLYAIATFVTGFVAPNEAPAADGQDLPLIVTVGMTAAEQDAVTRTVALFDEAGLELPPLTIRRHDDITGCNGHEGLHRIDGAGSILDICTTESGEWEQRTILHELSHAWAFHYLTPERKEAFKQLRGWEHWLDYDNAAWEDNGTEQAAEIMVWALSDHPVPVVKIDDNSCAALHGGYVALTGLEPLHGYTDRCNSTTNTRVS